MTMRIALLASSLLLPVSVAQAQTSPAGACCAGSTSRLDELINPVTGSDENFFAQPSGPPNVAFVIDNSCSMVNEWPTDFCGGSNHCNCEPIDRLGYDPKTVYEPEIKNLNSNSFHDEWFHANKVYDVRNFSNSSASYGQNVSNNPAGLIASLSGARDSQSSYVNACSAISGSTNRSTCQQCLATKGYFIGANSSRTDWRVTGNFLNHYSPRYLMARRVLKQVIRDIQPVRMFTMTFNTSGGSIGPEVLTDWNPPCTKSDPYKDASNFFSNRQNIINKLDTDLRFAGSTPLAKSLYAAGYAFQQRAVDGAADHVYSSAFGATWQTAMGLSNTQITSLTEKDGTNQKSVCFSCTFNAVILLTDGEPTQSANDNTVPGTNGTQIPRADCAQCSNSNLDEVAYWMWNADLRPDHAGQQKVATYTIGFGLDTSSWAHKLLRHTAVDGGGKYFPAHSTSQLKRAILDIFDDINSRNIAFSAANVASLQVTGAQAAIIPRMSPRKDLSWLGYLWRFGLHNEFVEDLDLNDDKDKDDVFIIDRDGDIVIEDLAGKFVKKDTGSRAEPFWEAGERLREKQGALEGWQARNVWTVRDSAAPAGAFTSADEVLRFTASNWQELKPYLGVAGTAACPTVNDDLTVVEGGLLNALNLSFSDASALYGSPLLPINLSALQLLADSVCHKVLIDWVLGRDLADEDGDGARVETRASVLGDIFHSSPVTIDPPVDKFLCDLGLHNQCVRTLYSDRLGIPHTPIAGGHSLAGVCGQLGRTDADAYDKYNFDNRLRQKVVLVGANDGMLHAFRDTRGVATCDSGVELIDFNLDADSGREAWALIPPDALSRLHLQLLEGHKYFIDGDIMVRDLWHDDSGDLKKQVDEFRTVAIAAMGRGGTHYFAVEIQWEDSGGVRVASTKPRFLWMFPQPCSDESALFGKTLYALSPKPPPVGPVLLRKCAAAVADPNDTTCGTDRYGEGTEERWVAMLSGGWSPGNEKGRGVYMVDAYNGVANSARNDNLLWKYDYDPAASGEKDEARQHMTHSIVAPVSMVDYGANENVRLDGFFDTAVVGDLAGQVWTFRMHKPGRIDASTKMITNWTGGRAFQQDRAGGISVAKKWPFFLPASIGLQPDNNALRAFIGTGNRYDLLATRAGFCRFDNPAACSKYGCDVNLITKVKKNTLDVTDAHTHWASQSYSHSRQGQSSASQGVCGIATAEVSTHDIGCGIGSVRQPQAECSVNAAGVYTCARTDTSTMNLGTVVDTASSTLLGNLGYNRFYGIWVYGRAVDRMFNEEAISTSATFRTAKEYDAARLSDRTSTGSDLVDVTATSCDAAGTCSGPRAASSGSGWFFEYRDVYTGTPNREKTLSHKTASGASLIASCVLWNSIFPETATGVCATPSSSRARFHQADFITGAPNCAFSFGGARFQERAVLAPPPEPATAVQISKTGQIRLSTLIVEPGQEQATTVSVSQNTDVLQSVYELPVPRDLHECRHTANGCRPVVP